ncbi:MAG TPA: rod-binding protein, partial [Ramlibacter sp.]
MSGPVAPNPTAASALEQRFALDVQGVDSLRRVARRSPDEGLRQVSRQFEALFMGMVLKSMRDATPASGLLEGQHTRMYMSMLDQQLAQHLSGRGLRLADSMYEQLRRSLGGDAAAASPAGPAGAPPTGAGAAR